MVLEENTEEVFLVESHKIKGANIHEGKESVQVKGKACAPVLWQESSELSGTEKGTVGLVPTSAGMSLSPRM